jgi:6-pyruvoyltetrahydropterin/6-carboxytetrahydropterin synthase
MYTVRIEDTFAAAHYLTRYHGKCENLHGHNYRVRVYVTGEELDEGGMLLDFGVLKKTVKGILNTLDHGLLNDLPYFSNGDPSAERIARFIYEETEKALPDAGLNRVEVFETDINMAAYSRP